MTLNDPKEKTDLSPEKEEDIQNITIVSSSVPLLEQFRSGSLQKRILYIDSDIDWTNPLNTIKKAIDSGFNVILLAFYLNTGPTNGLAAWASLSSAAKSQAFQYAASHNAILGFSAGGATEIVFTLNPTTYATTLAKYALKEKFQIVDCDLENIGPLFTYPGVNLYAWFKQFNATLLRLLGTNALVSHAPQLPYIAVPNSAGAWTGKLGGYFQVYSDNPGIAWFAFQVYNQNSYLTYATSFVKADPKMYPASSLGEISVTDNKNSLGIPWHKIVFGSYLQKNDANNGVHDPAVLKQWFEQAAKQFGYDGSIMIWQWHISGSPLPQQFIKKLYS